MSETKIWGIHGGATGDADPLFLQHNVVAIGWSEMGDPGKLKADREAFKAAEMKKWGQSRVALI